VKTSLYHVQINVGDAARTIPFYKALFAYFEYTTIMETHDLLAVRSGSGRARTSTVSWRSS
jgi:hypothetical protein